MSGLARTAAVAEMQARELLRRRAVLILLILLPISFYLSVPATEVWGLLSGAIGVSWAVAAAGVFAVLGWRRADPRLVLTGASPAQGFMGRFLLLAGLGGVLVVMFTPLLLIRSSQHISDTGVMVLGLVLMAVVSVAMGLVIGALVPRELEGTLILIGIVGVAMSVPSQTALAKALPLWGPIELIAIASRLGDGTAARAVAHAAVSVVLLLAVAWWGWHRRVRVAGNAASGS